ncbi:hypothetical protein DL767_006471 [Monosporascus sp. MG133]|nr:hypothetical protein DL767_006471 [Monosporascus sp. MG133]
MEIDIDEDDLLRNLAKGGSIDFSVWPVLLPRIISRVEKIAHEEFPIPNLPPPPSANASTIPSSVPRLGAQADSETTENFISPLRSSPPGPESSASSQDTNKENTPVAPRSTAPPTSAPQATASLPPGTLPPQIRAMLTEITSTLKSFPKYPPHTIQRLAELILTPTRHYRNLPTYLHALDRVVHVTSGLNIYPLPPAVPDMTSGSVLSNGIGDALDTSSSASVAPGSDEALGGALLTPIPWLQPNRQHALGSSPQPETQSGTATPGEPADGRGGEQGPGGLQPEVRTESTETVEGPNGMGSIETVSISVNGVPSMGARGVGVTQGELLRQEQRAGVVPVSQLVPNHPLHQQQARHANPANQQRGSPDSQASSDTMEEGGSPGDGQEGVASAPVASVSAVATDEEKPHARGPEEIGPEDMGPQPGGSATMAGTYAGGTGVDMQGIDVEAAVGRKAATTTTTAAATGSAAAGVKKSEDDADSRMEDVEEEGDADQLKREAEAELEGGSKKKLREDPEPDPDPGDKGAGAGGGAAAANAAD